GAFGPPSPQPAVPTAIQSAAPTIPTIRSARDMGPPGRAAVATIASDKVAPAPVRASEFGAEPGPDPVPVPASAARLRRLGLDPRFERRALGLRRLRPDAERRR